MHSTYSPKKAEIKKKWIHIDASNASLGRIAAFIAVRLQGKNSPSYAPHMDDGDFVVVTNANKVKLTGKKMQDKFYWHTGYPGGIKSITHEKTLESTHPERLLYRAVQRMLPKTKLGRKMLTHLRLENTSEHKYGAQQPQTIEFASINRKNIIGE